MLGDNFSESGAIADAEFPELVGEGDGVAIECSVEAGDTVAFEACVSQGKFKNHACGRLCCVQLTEIHFLADCSPAWFANEFNVEAVSFKET